MSEENKDAQVQVEKLRARTMRFEPNLSSGVDQCFQLEGAINRWIDEHPYCKVQSFQVLKTGDFETIVIFSVREMATVPKFR